MELFPGLQVCSSFVPREIWGMILERLEEWRGVASRVCKLWRELTPKREKWISASLVIKSYPLLAWALEEGLPRHRDLIYLLVLRGSLEKVQLARREGCPWDERTTSLAACVGNFPLLKWLRAPGEGVEACPWNSSTCWAAAGRGHLRILKWARKYGCPWDEATCSEASMGGHWEIVKWARRNGCPWDQKTYRGAILHDNLKQMKWLQKKGLEVTSSVFDYAIGNGSSEVIDWAQNNY